MIITYHHHLHLAFPLRQPLSETWTRNHLPAELSQVEPHSQEDEEEEEEEVLVEP